MSLISDLKDLYRLSLHDKYSKSVMLAILVGSFGAMMSGVVSEKILRSKRRDDLSAQVQQVSVALADIEKITESLRSLKDELQKTEADRARIEADYKKASQLKAVTEEQFLAVKSALEHRSLWQIVAENLFSFFVGVVSSLVASVIWFYATRPRKLSP